MDSLNWDATLIERFNKSCSTSKYKTEQEIKSTYSQIHESLLSKQATLLRSFQCEDNAMIDLALNNDSLLRDITNAISWSWTAFLHFCPMEKHDNVLKTLDLTRDFAESCLRHVVSLAKIVSAAILQNSICKDNLSQDELKKHCRTVEESSQVFLGCALDQSAESDVQEGKVSLEIAGVLSASLKQPTLFANFLTQAVRQCFVRVSSTRYMCHTLSILKSFVGIDTFLASISAAFRDGQTVRTCVLMIIVLIAHTSFVPSLGN